MTAKEPRSTVANREKVREQWLADVGQLVDQVEAWCKEQGWATRRALKEIEEMDLGAYQAPMLLIQQWDVQLLLEPIARFVGGADGRVDLYRMPQYDEVAMILRKTGKWRLRYEAAANNGASPAADRLRAFNKVLLVQVVEAMLAENAQA